MPAIGQDGRIIRSHERDLSSIPNQADLEIVNAVHRLREDAHSQENGLSDFQSKARTIDARDSLSCVSHLYRPLGRLFRTEVLQQPELS